MERRFNNVMVFIRVAFLTWCVYDCVRYDRGLVQLFDFILIVLWVVWVLFGIREDHKIVAQIDQAEQQKAEWEEKRKAFGAQ